MSTWRPIQMKLPSGLPLLYPTIGRFCAPCRVYCTEPVVLKRDETRTSPASTPEMLLKLLLGTTPLVSVFPNERRAAATSLPPEIATVVAVVCPVWKN